MFGRLGLERAYTRRRLTAGVALASLALALIGAVPSATAKIPEEPSTLCSTTGALVVFYTSRGVASKNDLVIGPDGSASLCWSRRGPSVVTGRTSFAVSRPTLAVLRAELNRIDVEHLGPPPAQWPPCCLGPARALVYRGMGIPYQGRPNTTPTIQALQRVQGILGLIIERHGPDL